MQHFKTSLQEKDPTIAKMIEQELKRQRDGIELIASENLVSKAVLEAAGSVLTNKYAEGYAGRRYYGGCEYVDEVEKLAITRACQLFGAQFANVQPHSGSQANQSVFFSLLQPGDKVLGMSLDCGGHLTHGNKANQSGKWFEFYHYGVDPKTCLLNYDELEEVALKHRPKMIIAGASAYSRNIDFARIRAVADQIDAYLMADVAHYAGLIVTGLYNNPLPHAHVVTTTTHKTLRGPRGGMVLTNEEDIAKKINSAIFPGIQGGPLMHIIAAKAVAFAEALEPEYKQYMQTVKDSAVVLAQQLQHRGFPIVSGGTDSHVMLVDLSSHQITGRDAERYMEKLGLICNKNTVPYDPAGPVVTSGIRLGTPAGVTRGFGVEEFGLVADLVADSLIAMKNSDSIMAENVKVKVQNLCKRFPIY